MQQPQVTSKNKMYATLVSLLVVFVLTGFLNYPKAFDVLGLKRYFDVPFRLGLDLKGGAHLVYEADLSRVTSKEQADALEGARDVIERRVNAFGVAEPLVEVASAGGVSRINVELAGVSDVQAAIKEIGETPILEFKVPRTTPTEDTKKELEAIHAQEKKEAETALAAERKSGFTGEKVVKTDFVHKLTAEYSGLVDQLTKMGAWKGMVASKVIETPDAYWAVKVDDVRRRDYETEAQHLLICYKGAEGCTKEWSKEEAYAKIKALVPTITAQNFGKIVAENSTEPGAVTSGGSLGWFYPAAMVDEFAEKVRAMRIGEITKEPVLTKFGYHLIYKKNVRYTSPVLSEYKLSVVKVMKTTNIVDPNGEWENTNLSGKDLETAVVQFNSQTGEPEVSLQFSSEGGDKFAAITKQWVGQQIAIFLDGNVISAPVVQQEITGGRAQITGRFTVPEAKTLARRLNAGALPVPIKLVSQSTVGPTLGAADLQKSLAAGVIGFILVALFMLFFYRLPGLVSVVALAFYTSVILAAYKLIPVTLSLSGIAGFIVTLGMAVDANVLIFERLREELKLGRTIGSAIDEGFKRAWSSIWDGNITTLFSALVLFYFTSSVIKGFALTLAIGVIVSMFSAITVTRLILKWLAGFEFAKRPWLYGVNK